LKVAWLCPYPVDLLPYEKVQWNKKKKFHPATWLVNLSNALSTSPEIDLHIITLSPWVRKDFRFEFINISFHILRSKYAIPFMLSGSQAILPADRLTKFYLDKKKVEKEIQNINPDLVHSHGTEFQYSHIAAQLDFPYIISVQGVIKYLKNHLSEYNWRLQLELEKNVIEKSDYFISKADFCTEFIKSINPGSHVIKIDDIVSDEFFKTDYSPVQGTLLFVGNVIKSKGIEEVIKAFIVLKKKYKKLTLRIVGYCDSKYKSILDSLINESKTEDIIFLGPVSSSALIKEYQNAEIFVFPSHFETSPNVIMEAMAVGLPTVTTKVGGITDMIDDGDTGFLINPKSVPEIIEKVEHFLNDKEFAQKTGQKAHQKALKKFTKDIVLNKTIDTYKFVLSCCENSSRN
jgi:glycosyltransferase involved in cell wall biosynthesis